MSLWEQAHSSESKSRTMEWLDQAAQPPTSPPEPPMVQVEDHVREATNAARSVFAIACRQLRPAARALRDLSQKPQFRAQGYISQSLGGRALYDQHVAEPPPPPDAPPPDTWAAAAAAADAVPPAPRSHHSGATSQVDEVAEMIQGMMAAQSQEHVQTASSWRTRCAAFHAPVPSRSSDKSPVRPPSSARCSLSYSLVGVDAVAGAYRVAGISQETQQSMSDSAGSPQGRSGASPQSSYLMAHSSDSEAGGGGHEAEPELAQLTASDRPARNRLDDFVTSLASSSSSRPRGLVGGGGGGRSSIAGSSTSVPTRRARLTPSPTPSSSISQQGQGYSPEAAGGSQPGSSRGIQQQQQQQQQPTGDISPRVLESFGGEMSPTHSGAYISLSLINS